MALTEEQEKALREVFPDSADQLIKQGQDQTKELEEQGIAHKEAEPEKEQDPEPAPQALDWDKLIKAVASEVADRLDVDVTEPLSKMGQRLEEMADRMDRYEQARSDEKEVGTTRYRLSLEQKQASEAAETVLDDDDELQKAKPKETDPKEKKSGADHFYPPK